MKGFLKFAKKFFLIVFVSCLFFILTGVVITYVFEDKIKGLCINRLNQNLNTEVHINGKDIHLSLFSYFPNAALRFENLEIRESYAGSKQNLVKAGTLSLVFNPLNIIKGRYKIHRIALENAEVNIRYDKLGRPNFEFWKSSDKADGQDQAFVLDLNSVELHMVKLLYEHVPDQRTLTADIFHANCSGRFSDDIYEMALNADALIVEYREKDIQYISDKKIILNTGFNVNNPASAYTIKKGKVAIEKTVFGVSGSFLDLADGTGIDLKIKGEETSIEQLMSLLPENYRAYFADYSSTGNIHFTMSVNGIASQVSSPAISADFGIRNGEIRYKNKSLTLEKVNFDGHYDNGTERKLTTSKLELKTFSCSLNGREINGSLSLSDFEQPSLMLDVNGSILLTDLQNFTEIKGIKKLAGTVYVDASFKGKLSDLKAYRTIGNTKLKGKLLLDKVSVIPEDGKLSYEALDGEFISDGNNLIVQDFTGKMAKTKFRFNGSFKNLASFLFLPDRQLEAEAALYCNLIDVNDFLEAEDGKNTDNTTYSFSLPTFLIFNFRLHADKVVYGKFSAANVKGKVSVNGKTALFKDISFQTMGGYVSLNGTVKEAENKKIITETTANLKNIDVSQMFYQLNNFSQEYLTDKHLKGKLNAAISFSSKWNPDLTADLNSITSQADISITDGRLTKLSTLVELGEFLRISSLDDLQFDKLSNRISIEKQVIYIPKMDINSSAMNMTVAGTHNFDNIVDYRMGLNMSQLLFGKKKSYENEFGIIEVDEKGGMKLFVHISGPGDNPKIVYDAKASGKNLKKGLIQEKNEIKNIMVRDTYPDGSLKKELNRPSDEYELDWGDEDNTPEKSVKEPKKQDADRKKAFDELKKKISDKK